VLAESVRQLAAAMASCDAFRWRIVVVDNGSTDGTDAVGRGLAEQHEFVRWLHLDRPGRGGALHKTWSETDAQFSLYMDVDLSTDLAAVPEAVRLLDEGADVVTGSRLRGDSQITRCFRREALSRIYNRLVRRVLGTRSFDDAQCGFKGVRIATVRPLLALVQDRDWFFDTELLVLAEYAGLCVRTMPIVWVEDPDSRVHVPATIWQDLRGVARLRRTARRLVREYEL